MEHQYRFVITGGPGVGKSTTIDCLFQLGYPVVTEAARVVIEHQQRRSKRFGESPIVPWTDLYSFQRLVYERQLKQESRRSDSSLVFCDRGVVDNHGYCKLGKIATPPEILEHICKSCYDHVFVLDPLPFYSTDGQRREDPVKALELHEAMIWAYKSTNHSLTNVPVMPPMERAIFILERAVELAKSPSILSFKH